jgi:hypothetical protein
MTNSKIDFTKPLQTRSGLKVRLLSTAFEFEQQEGDFSITAEVETLGYQLYTIDGNYYASIDESRLDLQNIPEETFEQKVERFKKSEFYVSDKSSEEFKHEVVAWDSQRGFHVWTDFEEAMHWVDF